jgi:oligopeptide transport system substrate-binding protein
MRHLKSLVAVVMVVTVGAFSGCTKKGMNIEQANKDQILLVGNGTNPSDLDPHITTGVPEHHIQSALFEGLVNYDGKLNPIPGIAESWTISKDGKTYVFKIRKNATWSNGDPLTAKDFVYGWQRILSPALGAEYAYMLFYIEGAEEFNKGTLKDFSKVGVKATDDHTLEVKLKASTPFFITLLVHHCAYPVHQATIEKHGKMDTRGTPWTKPENIVSNGPFILKTWDMNKVVSVVKNPKYWDAANVKLNGVNFYPTESQQTEERMFRSGELHTTNEMPLNKIDVYKKEHPEFYQNHPYLGTYFYRYNTTKKPLNDVRVRKALAMAVDRTAIVEKVTKGGQIPAYHFTPPGVAGYTPRAKFEYNPEAARKLLAEAGYPNGKDLGKIEILYNSSENHKVIAEAIQQMLKKELNAEITLANQDWKVYLDSQKSMNYQIARAGWIGDYPDPNTFLDMLVTNGGNNNTGWSNKEFDRLIAQAANTSDAAARLEVFQKAEQILIDEMPVMPIYIYTRVYLKHPSVKGWDENVMDMRSWKSISLEPVAAK